jgi:hypothetical protein
MAAALPYLDAFLPGDTPRALFGVIEAISDDEGGTSHRLRDARVDVTRS